MFLSMVIAACFSYCSDPPECFTSTGKIKTVERALDRFTGIHNQDGIHVYLTNDSGSTVRVEGGENLLPKIKTDVKNGVLYISNENTCNWVRSYKKEIKVYVGIKNVNDIFNYGFGNIDSDELKKDTFIVHHYGNGDIRLKLKSNYIWIDMDHLGDFNLEGTCNTFNATTINLGELKAKNFYCENIYLKNLGQGNSYVNASQGLYVSIENEGNVYYSGNPVTVNNLRNGKGTLIKAD